MGFKTYTDNSITLKDAQKLRENLYEIHIHYDSVFDEFKVEFYFTNLNYGLYLKTQAGHIKLFKTMKSMNKIFHSFDIKDVKLIYY